ncbi:MAG: hypothetical protein U1E51_07080 [Candidatus Binatia bacterium]|nr:hypothetical protein [Candidatus Binatia bacterium]
MTYFDTDQERKLRECVEVLKEMPDPAVWDDHEKAFVCLCNGCLGRVAFNKVPIPHSGACAWTRRWKILKEADDAAL